MLELSQKEMKNMILMRICLVTGFFTCLSAIVYAVQGQWSEVGQSIFYGILILMIAPIAEKDYHNRMNRKAQR